MATRSRYTNPIENLRSYIMVHQGIDRSERQSDVEWVEDKIKAGDLLSLRVRACSWSSISEEKLEELQKLAQKWSEI